MDAWLDGLRTELTHLWDAGLRRERREATPMERRVWVGDRDLLNLAGNDYLGLASHPRLRQAAVDAVSRLGVGAGASPLITGHHPLHAQVEARFAAFKHAERALILPTGYTANLAVLTALARRGDLICLDKLCHASLIDAARSSGATVRAYPHGNLARLARLLERGAAAGVDHKVYADGAGLNDADTGAGAVASDDMPAGDRGARRKFIVTDSVFSMDGDVADLPALCDLADRHDAILVVDEAHGTGVLGATGAGLSEQQGVAERVDVTVSTASKALGGLGGIVTARALVIEMLIHRARPLIYSTAPPPAQVAVIGAAIDVVRDEPWRRERLATLSRRLREGVSRHDWLMRPTWADGAVASAVVTPIVPLVVGSTENSLALAAHLAERGILAPAIRPPSVGLGSSRVRLTLRADLTDDDLNQVLAALGEFRPR